MNSKSSPNRLKRPLNLFWFSSMTFWTSRRLRPANSSLCRWNLIFGSHWRTPWTRSQGGPWLKDLNFAASFIQLLKPVLLETLIGSVRFCSTSSPMRSSSLQGVRFMLLWSKKNQPQHIKHSDLKSTTRASAFLQKVRRSSSTDSRRWTLVPHVRTVARALAWPFQSSLLSSWMDRWESRARSARVRCSGSRPCLSVPILSTPSAVDPPLALRRPIPQCRGRCPRSSSRKTTPCATRCFGTLRCSAFTPSASRPSRRRRRSSTGPSRAKATRRARGARHRSSRASSWC
mmetsp:Transcript_74528/g.199258  ORF Transcript_74528/g.199258 Transcript_74528/m.199258 type:complete len:288 (+) Transcript_74528:837-1700(+)